MQNLSFSGRLRIVLNVAGAVPLETVAKTLGVPTASINELLENRMLKGEERTAILEEVGEPVASWLIQGERADRQGDKAMAEVLGGLIRAKREEEIVFARLREKIKTLEPKRRVEFLKKVERAALIS